MRHKLFGRSGLRVSELCLGTQTFGENWGALGSGPEESRKVFVAGFDDHALTLGGYGPSGLGRKRSQNADFASSRQQAEMATRVASGAAGRRLHATLA